MQTVASMNRKCLHFRMNSNFGLVFIFLRFFAEITLCPALLAVLSGPSLSLLPAYVVALSCRRAIAVYTRNALAARTTATSTPAVSHAAPSVSNSRRLCSTHRQTRRGLCTTAPAHSATAQESTFCQVQNSRSSSSADLWVRACGGVSATSTADTSEHKPVSIGSFSAIKLSPEVQVAMLYTRPAVCLFLRQSALLQASSRGGSHPHCCCHTCIITGSRTCLVLLARAGLAASITHAWRASRATLRVCLSTALRAYMHVPAYILCGAGGRRRARVLLLVHRVLARNVGMCMIPRYSSMHSCHFFCT